MVKTIAIVSLKGGVGKTSSVVSLGAALAEFGQKVLLVDANFSAPNLGIHLNLINPAKTIHHVMDRLIAPKEAVHEVEGYDHLHVIPADVHAARLKNPLKLRDRLKSLKRGYDYVLIDSSPSLNEETLGAMLAADEVFVVTTPDYSTLSMALKAIKLAKGRGANITGLILNRVYDKHFELSLEDIESTAEVPVLAMVPHDTAVPAAQASFVPVLSHNPSARGSEEFKRLAAALTGDEYVSSPWRKFINQINPAKEEINRAVYYKSQFG